MAFRQPAFVSSRQAASSSHAQHTSNAVSTSPIQSRVEESQEWILFPSRQTESSIDETLSSLTERTTQTAGLSRASDLISVDSVLRSGRLSEEALEDHELDSLDDNLHAFRESSLHRTTSNPLDQNETSILPAHDGLGTFPSSHVQDQIWQHEQHNPKRKFDGRSRRRSSVQRRLDTIEEAESYTIDEEKRLRIEKWRLDQSRALLQELERETRRRARREGYNTGYERMEESQETPTASLLGTTPTQQDVHGLREPITEETEPLWTRLTRRFIQDIIGIDESLLPIILGESLPEVLSEDSPSPSLSAILEQPGQTFSEFATTGSGWKDRLLHRIARELGVLAQQISSHPGAFTAYAPASSTDGQVDSHPVQATLEKIDQLQSEESNHMNSTIGTSAFIPTAQDLAYDASWGLDEDEAKSTLPKGGERRDTQHDKDYWERDLDVAMIFRFLHNRFTSSQPAQGSTPTASQESAKRAAVIRLHHPLVARAHQRSMMKSRRDSSLHIIRRSSSSCASQSLRSSKRGSLVRSGTSSRNYWDIGGSLGSESAVASGGMMGAWGEV